MTAITFTFSGDTQIDRTIARVQASARNAAPAFEAMAERFAEAEHEQFASEGAYGSTGWAPLSPRYAAWKAAHYPGPILVRTGALEESLTARPFGVEVIEPQFAAFGTDVAYAGFHQHGTDKMPARPPVDLPESEKIAWVKLLQRWLITGAL